MIFFHHSQRWDALRILTAMGVPKSARTEIKDDRLFTAAAGGFLLVIDGASALRIPRAITNHAKSPGWTTIIVKETSARFQDVEGFR